MEFGDQLFSLVHGLPASTPTPTPWISTDDPMAEFTKQLRYGPLPTSSPAPAPTTMRPMFLATFCASKPAIGFKPCFRSA